MLDGGRRLRDDRLPGLLKVQQLVVVEMEEPRNASCLALGERPLHYPRLAGDDSLIRIGLGLGVDKGRHVAPRGGGEERLDIGRVFDRNEDVRRPQRAVVAQPRVKAVRTTNHYDDCEG